MRPIHMGLVIAKKQYHIKEDHALCIGLKASIQFALFIIVSLLILIQLDGGNNQKTWAGTTSSYITHYSTYTDEPLIEKDNSERSGPVLKVDKTPPIFSFIPNYVLFMSILIISIGTAGFLILYLHISGQLR